MTRFKSIRFGNLSVPNTIHTWLLASSCFSCLLLLGRMLVTQSLEYIFLPWNLFLGFIPYYITNWLTTGKNEIIKNKIKLFTGLAAWLLFIPNSFYIITDLVHFTHIRSAPKWFDLLLIFSFAWNGILYGIISLRMVEIISTSFKGKKFSLFLVFAVMWLSAYGIYIGRYLRFNSWDIITDPFSLAGEILNMIVHPFHNLYPWGMTWCYAVFMTLLYFTIKKMSESFRIIK